MESEKQHEFSQKNCSRNFSGAAQVKERPLRVGDSQALCEELSTDVGVWTWTRPTPAQGGSYDSERLLVPQVPREGGGSPQLAGRPVFPQGSAPDPDSAAQLCAGTPWRKEALLEEGHRLETRQRCFSGTA